MVDTERLVFEENNSKYRKNRQRDHFLNNFQLPQVERSPIARETDPVGWHLQGILKQGDAPTYENHPEQPQIIKPVHFLELQMPVPRERHKRVGQHQQSNGENGLFHPMISKNDAKVR